MIFTELEQADGTPGRRIAFAGVEVRPLDYAALATAKLHAPLTIPLGWDNARIVDTNIPDLDLDQLYSANATLETPFTSHAVCLVRGGWLPSSLAATIDDSTMLLDRNLVPQLVGRMRRRANGGVNQDFLDLLADQPVRLHPLLYAMEGNARAIPTPDQLRAQLDEAVRKLQAAMPLARVVADPNVVRGALGLIEDAREGFIRKQDFLLRVAPALAAPVAQAKLQETWDKILAAADACGVARTSLVVLAALSTAAVPNGASPAKALLKPKRGYSQADAYNALADLRALELLLGLFALYPAARIQLCTADRPLALFWAGLCASGFERRGQGFAFDLSPVEALLPGPTLDAWRAAAQPP
ncbi:MAG: hypothetical protein GC203_10625 [Phenylobacterium sp.]|uniref:hypothetical protein n=1 Tax=Phenylobacterium sp. TaxID=1871053 RepID=UPI0025DEECA2|nr:hypothetical protein [Phenylobacterium sp.]MBI1198305.1 hypothetical protein [Phenylobacterium sp.]